MIDDKDLAQKTQKEVKWWDWAARILPAFSVVVIGFCHYFGFNDLRDVVIGITILGFAITAIVWWWWAIYKISWLANLYTSVVDSIKEVKTETKEIDRDLKE